MIEYNYYMITIMLIILKRYSDYWSRYQISPWHCHCY